MTSSSSMSSSSASAMMAPLPSFSTSLPTPSRPSPLRNFSMSFHPSCYFSTSYQRNNKSNGQKNLRCFPGHCFEGHRTGWCGHPLVIRCKGGSHQMRLVGAFAPRSDLGNGEEEVSSKLKPKFTLGAIVSKQELDDKLRSGLLAECMEGFVEEVPKECDVIRQQWEHEHGRPAPPEGSDREFVFNSKSKGWHYGFLGSKKDSNVWHLWSVFALEPSEKNPDLYTVVARLDSPPFQLFCRRRNRGPLAKARVEAAQEIPAVGCKCIYPDSTSEELAAAVPSPMEQPLLSMKEKKTPRKRTMDSALGSASSASSSATSMSSADSFISKSAKKIKQPTYVTTIPSISPQSPAALAARAAVAASMASQQIGGDYEQDRRMEMVLDIVRRIQLPGSTNLGPAAAARRSAHSALVLVPGQDAADFGEHVLRLARHWKQMDLRGVPPPLQYAQQLAMHYPPDDMAPPFATFLLSQADFAETVISLTETANDPKGPHAAALRAAERMLWILKQQVIAVQRARSERRMMAAPAAWGSVVPGQTPTSPIPPATPSFTMSLPQDLLPSSPILGFGMPFLMMHRRRMGSNTSTGSDPSVMMTDFDLEWFSKSLDALHTDGGAPSL